MEEQKEIKTEAVKVVILGSKEDLAAAQSRPRVDTGNGKSSKVLGLTLRNLFSGEECIMQTQLWASWLLVCILRIIGVIYIQLEKSDKHFINATPKFLDCPI